MLEYSPLERFVMNIVKVLVADYSLKALITRTPNSFGEPNDFFYAKNAFMIAFMYVFLCLLVQILWKKRPEIKNIWNSGGFIL